MAHTSVYDGRQLGNIWIDILRNPLPQVCVYLLSLTTPGGEGRGGEGRGEGRGGERGGEGRGRGGVGEGRGREVRGEGRGRVVHVQLGR